MNLTPDQATALLGGLVTAVLAFLEYLRRKLVENTHETRQAKHKAHEAEQAALSVQQATFDRLDYDRLRRLEAALLTLDECAPCREKILAVTDRRRLRPHVKEPTDV
jgi:hypothetical protein